MSINKTHDVKRFIPELLAPAGNLEKLKVAVQYGADAVYLGGQKFGLRSAADNFTLDEIKEGVEFAHNHGSQTYIVLNSFFHDEDFDGLPEFLKYIESVGIDAVIVSDLGVVHAVREHCSIPVHLSTQASCLNTYAAKFWKAQGVTRVVLGREVSVSEAKKIKEETGLEIEMFIHGSMCMAYSGNCVISNYTMGRDSNRGGCAHSCRFEYSFQKDNEKKLAYFMSSKDLEGIRVLQEFIDAGIDSLKVEGRMKTHHYVGTISKVYSDALNFYRENGHFLSDSIEEWERELSKVTHRDYHSGNLVTPANEDSVYKEREHNEKEYNIVGIVLEEHKDEYLLVEVRHAFYQGNDLELMPFDGATKTFRADWVHDFYDRPYEKTKPGIIVKLPWVEGANPYNIIRTKNLEVSRS